MLNLNNLKRNSMENNKVPTAKELFDKMLEENSECTSTEMMIEFAKLHVETALKEASEKSYAQSSHSNITSKDWTETRQGLICVHLGRVSVNKQSILNSYPLSNIK